MNCDDRAACVFPRTRLRIAGQKMSFARRGKDAQCLQGGEYKRPPPVNTTCECGEKDVECDFGFVSRDGKCLQLPKVGAPDGTTPTPLQRAPGVCRPTGNWFSLARLPSAALRVSFWRASSPAMPRHPRMPCMPGDAGAADEAGGACAALRCAAPLPAPAPLPPTAPDRRWSGLVALR